MTITDWDFAYLNEAGLGKKYGLPPKVARAERLRFKVESYFARQMGMTVPQWREAQARARL